MVHPASGGVDSEKWWVENGKHRKKKGAVKHGC
jgi:hypothetical protein